MSLLKMGSKLPCIRNFSSISPHYSGLFPMVNVVNGTDNTPPDSPVTLVITYTSPNNSSRTQCNPNTIFHVL